MLRPMSRCVVLLVLTAAGLSAQVARPLTANMPYRIEMSDFYNMSYLDSNRSFSAAGGTDGPSNRFDIYGVRVLAIDGTEP